MTIPVCLPVRDASAQCIVILIPRAPVTAGLADVAVLGGDEPRGVPAAIHTCSLSEYSPWCVWRNASNAASMVICRTSLSRALVNRIAAFVPWDLISFS